MQSKNIIHYERHVLDLYKMFEQVEVALSQAGFDVLLHHLVKLRASQINGCAFCVNMHTTEARKDGETDRRLDHLIVWRHVDYFSAAEKAALAWTELLTTITPEADYETARSQLLEHYSEEQISVLTYIIVMINSWNRLQVSKH